MQNDETKKERKKTKLLCGSRKISSAMHDIKSIIETGLFYVHHLCTGCISVNVCLNIFLKYMNAKIYKNNSLILLWIGLNYENDLNKKKKKKHFFFFEKRYTDTYTYTQTT